MNITYLIGNGFDVNIGLKSSYADFYKSYVNNHLDNEADVVTRFKNKISQLSMDGLHWLRKKKLSSIRW
jgi:hypothetical protein